MHCKPNPTSKKKSKTTFHLRRRFHGFLKIIHEYHKERADARRTARAGKQGKSRRVEEDDVDDEYEGYVPLTRENLLAGLR